MVKDGFNGFSDDLHDFGDNKMNSYGPEDANGAEELPDIVSRPVGDEIDDKLDFQYFFLSVGAFIKGFAHMRMVIDIDGTILSGSDELCIISDRHLSIRNGFKNVFTATHHGFCMRHIAENMRKREVANCLANKIGFQKWSRAFFLGNQYSALTTNIAESLNAMLKDQRDFPIIGLFNHIIRKFAEQFEERRNEMKNVLTLFVPSVEKKIRNNMVVGDALRVHQLENDQFSVVRHGIDAVVDLDLNTYFCYQFDLEKIPCRHAMETLRLSFGDGYGSSIYDHSSPFYKVLTYLVAYEGTIHAIHIEEKWAVPDEIQFTKILPSDVEPIKGRKKFKRWPSILEPSSFGSRKKGKNKCSICKELGHKKMTCKVLLQHS
nr:uncharacterized protein LOC104101132 [Nicotiana tomentosiformis]